MPTQTVTFPAETADESVEKMMEILWEQWDWVERGDSHPIFYAGRLQYTITIDYGKLV